MDIEVKEKGKEGQSLVPRFPTSFRDVQLDGFSELYNMIFNELSQKVRGQGDTEIVFGGLQEIELPKIPKFILEKFFKELPNPTYYEYFLDTVKGTIGRKIIIVFADNRGLQEEKSREENSSVVEYIEMMKTRGDVNGFINGTMRAYQELKESNQRLSK